MAVLYRTHRPQKWSEVSGQDHVVNALRDSVSGGRIGHAFLFSGSRGTGKTTVARIFAKEIKTAPEDVFEIDAASNRGIDDIRELRENVNILPFTSPYKVYIIDEVHMLSKEAWNALLKTLEEPPKHVIFILATTEIEKVPDTIISRCQCFVFRKPGREIIRKQVELVAKKEKFDLDPGAADLVALLAEGSFRDALGILEKVISASGDKKLTRQEVEKITGAPRSELVNGFVASLIGKKADTAFKAITDANELSVSMNTFAMLVLERLRYILLVQSSASSAEIVKEKVSADDWDFISKQASLKLLTPDMLTVILEAADETGRARIESMPLEIATAKICGIV